jgi:deoxyribose-phosphate aldolase
MVSDMEAVSLPVDILSNPTEAEAQMIETVGALLAESEKSGLEETDLANARNEFINMAVAAIVAQAIPDLLKKEDIVTIKEAFSDFNNLKAVIMENYAATTEEYYDDMRTVISKDAASLEARGLLTNKLLKKGLSNLTRQEIDGLMKKIREAEVKGAEETWILEEEARLRAEHNVDKAYANFVKEMAGLLNGFTAKLYGVLNESGIALKTNPPENAPLPIPAEI